MVDWQAFTWEAFATLVTGLAAVAAAVAVALRQSRIVERQIALQESELRIALFERRAVIYNIVRNYIAAIVYSGAWFRPDFSEFSSFEEAVETCRFLFSERLYLEVNATHSFVSDGITFAEFVRNEWRDSEEANEADHAEMDRRFIELKRRYHSLPALFAAEMAINFGDRGFTIYSGAEIDDKPDLIGPSEK